MMNNKKNNEMSNDMGSKNTEYAAIAHNSKKRQKISSFVSTLRACLVELPSFKMKPSKTTKKKIKEDSA